MYGNDGKKDTPVPIPNTEVKLLSADCSEGFPFVRVGRRRAIIKAFQITGMLFLPPESFIGMYCLLEYSKELIHFCFLQ